MTDKEYIKKLEEENSRLKGQILSYKNNMQILHSGSDTSICKSVLHNSPAPVILCDNTEHIVSFNESFLRLFGITDEISKNMSLKEIKPSWKEYTSDGTYIPFEESPLGRIQDGRKRVYQDNRIVRSDQTERWYSAQSTPLYDEDGRYTASFITYFDTTLRKEKDYELGENRALFHSLVESIPHNIFSKDTEGRFIFANNRYCKTEGLSYSEIIGKTDFDLHPEEYAQKYISDDRKVMETEEIFQTVETHFPKDGSPVHVQVVKAPLYDGQKHVRGMIGIFWDITEQKEAEEALKRSEAQIRDLARNIPGVIFQFKHSSEHDLHFSFLSEQTGPLFGIQNTDPDFTKKFLQSIPDEEGIDFISTIKNSIRKKKNCECIFPYVRDDNERLWIHAIATPTNTDKELIFNGVFLDITRARKTEERNRHLEEQFYSVQRMKAVGTLAGGIAHNINNVLMGIQGRISLINMEPDNITSCLEHIKLIEQYVNNAADMTRDLLAFARGGKYEVRPSDINALLHQEIRLFSKTRKDITLTHNFSDTMKAVEIDRNQIRQAFLLQYNLLRNLQEC